MMQYFPFTAELARHISDERLAAAERRHRMFRRPIITVPSDRPERGQD